MTFAIALLVFLYQRQYDPELFNNAQGLLNKTLGTINTLALVTSGFFMATTIRQLQQGHQQRAFKFILLTLLFGLLFLVLKSFEYHDKLHHGYGFGYNRFFNFYWLLTGFHFIHVLVGVVILSYMAVKIKQGYYNQHRFEDVETGAVFWHMCDLIWIFLFPVIYLIH